MLEPTTAFPVWSTGDQVLYRFWRLDGSLSAVHPARVAESSWDALLCWVLPGTPIRVSSSPDGRKPREMSLVERFSGPRVPAWSTWRNHPTLRLVYAHRWASVWWFFEPDGTFRNWYVNLELPLGHDGGGINRVDGVLDVEVTPDLQWQWKDEDELDAAMSAGRFDSTQLRQLRAEGDRMIALAESGKFPFDGTYCDWRPDPDWTVPALPAALLD